MTDVTKDDHADLLYGVESIAAYLKMTRRQVYHLHDQGHIPTFKVGGKVCARPTALAAYFAAQEAAARAATNPGGK